MTIQNLRSLWASSALAFTLGVFAHLESLGYWFTSYDSIALIKTSRISSFGDVWSILTKPLLYGTTYVEAGKFYRPVINLTYAVEYEVWGLNPVGYHLTNLVLHGLAGALVVITVYSLTDSLQTGALTGVLFAIHPLSVDTVPAISRRQDILLAIFGLLTLYLFIEGFRREDNRLHAGAVVAYALGLLSMETAIIVGPLAFLWVVFQQPSIRRSESYLRAVSAVLPLAVVAGVYLAIRIAVLDGIGGYTHDPPLAQVILFPVEYLLSLTYQANFFGVIQEFSPVLLIIVTITIPTLYLLLFRRDRSLHNIDAVSFLFVTITVASFAVLTAVLVVPDALSSLNLYNVQSVGWYAAGVAFTVAAASAVAAALLSKPSRTTSRDRLSGFFLVWLASPLPLFFTAQQFAFRDAYFFAIPFLALLARYLVEALSRLDSRKAAPSPNGSSTVLVLAVLVLLAPTVAASPLLYSDSGWGDSGNITKQTLTEVNDSVSRANSSTRVIIVGMPTKIKHDPHRLGQARKVTMLQPHSVRAWLQLQGNDNPVTVGSFRSFNTVPQKVSTTTYRKNRMVVRIHYRD